MTFKLFKKPNSKNSKKEIIMNNSTVQLEITYDKNSKYEIVRSVKYPSNKPLSPRSKPFTVDEWNTHKTPTGVIKDFELVKKKIFERGLEPCLRKEVWKYLLGYWNPNHSSKKIAELAKKDKNFYHHLKKKWETLDIDVPVYEKQVRSANRIISMDVIRTDKDLPFYAGENNVNSEKMERILTAYSMLKFHLGYAQGMSDMLSPLLMVLDDEVDAFWCFAKLMERMGKNFELNQQATFTQLNQLSIILKALDQKLYEYLDFVSDSAGSTQLIFFIPYILIWFKRAFNVSDIHLLWDMLWTSLPCKNYQLIIAYSILRIEMKKIMAMKLDKEEILMHFNNLSSSCQLDLENVLLEAENIYEQLQISINVPTEILELFDITSKAYEKEERRRRMAEALDFVYL